MNYLVTGGAGFIGTNVVKRLLTDGHRVRVLDNYSGHSADYFERVKQDAGIQKGMASGFLEYVEGDICDLQTVQEAMKNIDGVFHIAALPRVIYSIEHPLETHDVNVNGTLNVLLAARDAGVKRVVFSSSSAAAGDQPRDAYPLKEDGIVKMPLAPYALHKLIGEHYCRLFAELYTIETVSLVYFNVYGPYIDPEGAYALVIGKFLQQRKEGKPMTVRGDGEMCRDYTHVDDVVEANILAMTKETVGKGEVIHVGFGHPYSVNELAQMIGGPTITVDPLPGEMVYTEADNTKARSLLDWKPTIELPDGIVQMKKEFGVE